jgi:PIN domain nuclease of toxin-antitoxin system
VSNWILDASALLAVINTEPGRERVVEALDEGAAMSSVNFAEIVSKLDDYGWTEGEIRARLQEMRVEILQFDGGDAYATGLLRRRTRSMGLSLGDRACLSLASRERVPALTAERTWSRLQLDAPIEIEVIR